eukprot:987852-Rhodomonas_salina.3
MDGNGVGDDGVDALASSLEGGFAPHLQVAFSFSSSGTKTTQLWVPTAPTRRSAGLTRRGRCAGAVVERQRNHEPRRGAAGRSGTGLHGRSARAVPLPQPDRSPGQAAAARGIPQQDR